MSEESRVEVESFLTPEAAAQRYPRTPSWDPREVPAEFVGSFHVGGGVFRAQCRSCPAYTETYGSVPRHCGIGRHEVDVHNLLVPGINVGLLATAATPLTTTGGTP